MTHLQTDIEGDLEVLRAAIQMAYSAGQDPASLTWTWRPPTALRWGLRAGGMRAVMQLPTLLVDRADASLPQLGFGLATGGLAPLSSLLSSGGRPRALVAALREQRHGPVEERVVWRTQDGSLQSASGAWVLPFRAQGACRLAVAAADDPAAVVTLTARWWGHLVRSGPPADDLLAALRLPGPQRYGWHGRAQQVAEGEVLHVVAGPALPVTLR